MGHTVNCMKVALKKFFTQPQTLTKLTRKHSGEKRERDENSSSLAQQFSFSPFSLQLLFDFRSSWFNLKTCRVHFV